MMMNKFITAFDILSVFSALLVASSAAAAAADFISYLRTDR